MVSWQDILQDRRLVIAALVILGILVIYSLVSAISGVIPRQRVPYATPVALKSSPTKIPDIAAMHLFGLHQSKFLPHTRLDLKLIGIFFSSVTGRSQAIIGVPGGDTKVYMDGQEIADGAVLHRILPNKVILLHNNKLENLPLLRQSVVLGKVLS